MRKPTERTACPCGKSKDSFAPGYRTDGQGYCFRPDCDHKYLGNSRSEFTGVESKQLIPFRGLDKDTIARYNLFTRVVGETPSSWIFEYDGFEKHRAVDTKTYRVIGNHKHGVYGKKFFDKAPLKYLCITEGEIDAASVQKMTGIPTVSVQSATSAVKDVSADFDWINTAERIYVIFDADVPGDSAAAKVAPMFDFNKVFKVVLDPELKDANKYLEKGMTNEFMRQFKAAKKFVPDGVIATFGEVLEAFQEKRSDPICAWPIKSLEKKLDGIRLGKSYLVSGLEGIGKTELVRATEAQVIKHTDFNIGVIHLEESKKDTLDCLLSYHVDMPLRKTSDTFMTPQDKLKAYEEMVRRDGRVHIYSHFGSDDPNKIVEIIRYLVTVCECKVIFLDHINIVVSGLGAEADERRVLDYLCTKLATLVVELDFAFVYVCHENDDGRPRGSRNISQTAHVHIRLSRSVEAEDQVERDKLHMMVAKNRPTSNTGPSGYGYFEEAKGHLVDPFEHEEDRPT